MTAARSSELVQRLRNLHAHSGDPDTVAEAATTLENLEGVRAERDVLQEIVDEQREQIAKLVSRVEELTLELAEVREERRLRLESLHAAIATARRQRDEARREACLLLAGKCGKSAFVSADAIAEAQRRGWDCFPEATP